MGCAVTLEKTAAINIIAENVESGLFEFLTEVIGK
jgi:hypothetical protein